MADESPGKRIRGLVPAVNGRIQVYPSPPRQSKRGSINPSIITAVDETGPPAVRAHLESVEVMATSIEERCINRRQLRYGQRANRVPGADGAGSAGTGCDDFEVVAAGLTKLGY
ncbi:hypothetical protein MMC32_000090 [Xylographa parallela]|nr:hypothetical protein [Xylographa parallela]